MTARLQGTAMIESLVHIQADNSVVKLAPLQGRPYGGGHGSPWCVPVAPPFSTGRLVPCRRGRYGPGKMPCLAQAALHPPSPAWGRAPGGERARPAVPPGG